MKLTDTQIHRAELLITLDYLIKKTDKSHPAKQSDIIVYAKDTYNFTPKRQRISECLKYIQDLSNNYSDNFPFHVEQTTGGKYYIDSRYLLEGDVFKILISIKNDSYIDEDDTKDLIDDLLDVFVSETKQSEMRNKLSQVDVGIEKNTDAQIKKYDLFEKAWCNKWAIDIIQESFGRISDYPLKYGKVKEKVLCRVYKIQDYHGKRYAVLVPIENGRAGIIYDAIDNIVLPEYKREREIFVEDEDYPERIDELFKTNNPALADMYDNLDDYLKQNFQGGKGIFNSVSFYFDYQFVNQVKQSFMSYFARDLEVHEANHIDIDEEAYDKDYYFNNRHFQFGIRNHDSELIERIRYGVVNININRNEFMDWLLTNPNIEDKVKVVSPASITMNLFNYHFKKANKYIHDLERIIDKTHSTKNHEWGIELLQRYINQASDMKEWLSANNKRINKGETIEC